MLDIVSMTAFSIDRASACCNRRFNTDKMDGRSTALPAVILRLTRASPMRKSSEAPVRLGFRKALALPDSTCAASYTSKTEANEENTISTQEGLVPGAMTIDVEIQLGGTSQ